MEVTEALDQISHIHAQMAKGEVYRGSRPLPILLAALVGIGGALAEPGFVSPGDTTAFVRYWTVLGLAAGAISASEFVAHYLLREDRFTRRRTRQVAAPLGATLLAGVAMTVALATDPAFVPLLPGLWAMTFGLGIVAIRPFAPRGAGWVAAFYLAAGASLLYAAGHGAWVLSRWSVGGTFGLGQIAAALVMHLDFERNDDGQARQAQG